MSLTLKIIKNKNKNYFNRLYDGFTINYFMVNNNKYELCV